MEGSDCFIWIGWIRWVKAVKVKHLYLSSLHIQLTLIPLVYSPCLSHSNGHYRKLNPRPHIAQGWSGWWPNRIGCTVAVRPWGPYTRPISAPSSKHLLWLTHTPSWIALGRTMAVLALSLHHTSIFSLTPPKPSHDQSKSFLDLTSQDNYFRPPLKLDWTLLDIF